MRPLSVPIQHICVHTAAAGRLAVLHLRLRGDSIVWHAAVEQRTREGRRHGQVFIRNVRELSAQKRAMPRGFLAAGEASSGVGWAFCGCYRRSILVREFRLALQPSLAN